MCAVILNTMENNKLIAEFMGFELQKNPNERWFNQWFTNDILNKPYHSRIEILHFDSDWNWLMEAVDKIESIGDEENNGEYFFEIYKFGVTIFSNGNYVNEIVDTTGKTKLEATYKAVVEFINYYNAIK
jgi:hypothetical protein